VGDAETRSDAIWIVRSEQAVAALRTIAGVNHRAGKPVRRRVRSGRTETDHAVMEFIQRLLKIPAETIVQGQLAGDLPAILRVQSPRSATVEKRLPVTRGNVVVLPQQETSPGAADAGSRRQHLPIEGLRGFSGAIAIGGGQIGFRRIVGRFIL